MLAIAVIGLAGVAWWQSGGAGPGLRGARGDLAPPLPGALGAWREVGRIPADLLRSDGPVVALEIVEDDILVLQHNHWYRLAASGLVGPFGDATRGSPDWIERAVDFAWHDGHVYVIDGGRNHVSVWTDAGIRQREISLELDDAITFEPEQLEIDEMGRLYIVAHVATIHSPGDWLVLRVTDDTSPPDTLWREPGGEGVSTGANTPRLSVRDSGEILIATALDFELRRLDPDGRISSTAVRPDPPVFPVPDSVRRQHEEILALLPPSMHDAYTMPEHVPPVRGVSLRADGSVIARVARTFETSYIEWLGADGTPLGRLSADPMFEPIHVGNDVIHRVREEVGGVVIEAAPVALPE